VSVGNVLVMETNQSMAQVVSQMIESVGWNTVLSFSLEMGLGMMDSNRVHLCLFDCMPNSEEITKTVSAFKQKSSPAALCLMPDSRYSRAPIGNIQELSKSAGAEFFLPKPFAPDKLKIVLDRTVKLLRARKTNQHVKIIEDNGPLRLKLIQALQEMGYEVSSAKTMEDAFGQSDMIDVDVVVNDIFMPGMGGIQGIIEMRRDWPHVKIIAMSEAIEGQMSSNRILAAAKQIGASETLTKPFAVNELIAAVKRQFEVTQTA
jgi:DNA-binding NtrC family response regulator